MAKFDIEKNGYNINQVQSYINTLCLKYEEKLAEQKDRLFALKSEMSILQDKLNTFELKDKQISKALIFAVEKAEQIENNASKIYNLEIRRIRLIYDRWLDVVEMISNDNTTILTDQNKQNLDDFKKTVDLIVQQNLVMEDSVKNILKKNSDGYIRNLLNCMDYVLKSSPKNSAKIKRHKLETANNSKNNNSKFKVTNANAKIEMAGSDNIVDKYLYDGKIKLKESVFSKNIVSRPKYPLPNESGFDLEEALNPKEDLDEIMRAFNFFNSQAD